MMIIVVFGLPGTGKSFLSRHLTEKINAEYFNTDITGGLIAGQKVHITANVMLMKRSFP